MGADLALGYLAITFGQEPDFKPTYQKLAAMTDREIAKALSSYDQIDPSDLDDDYIGDARQRGIDALQTIEAGWNGERRDFTMFTVRGLHLLVTGEMTSGDCPEGLDAMGIFETLGLDVAAGFGDPHESRTETEGRDG